MKTALKETKKIESPNTPDYIDSIVYLIVSGNENLKKYINPETNRIEIPNADMSKENLERMAKEHQNLITAIRKFEEALLYL